MEEVTLVIEGHVFKMKKDILCEHSDYFKAMFSGNYVETEQPLITIDVIDANSMKIIIDYMVKGLIDLTEYSLPVIGDLATAANFLQITELIKQIEYTLDINLSVSNWMETMSIAETVSYSKLECLAAAFGLYSFKDMQPSYIPSIQKLYWYLSHPYLDAESELQVFKFGYQWMSDMLTGADGLLVVLGCLDIKKLTPNDLREMKTLMRKYDFSLAAKIVDCLYELYFASLNVTVSLITGQKSVLCEMFTESVYNEVLHLVRESRPRETVYVPAIPMWIVKNEKVEITVPHSLYTFKPRTGFVKWLEVAEATLWGWHVVSWGLTKIVVVGGERGRGTGIFQRDVRVYDTLRQEWINHGVQLPERRHGGVVIHGDLLYLVGGVGSFRVMLETAIVYDLKMRTFRRIANFPEINQTPAVCVHEDNIYASGHNNIYKYEDRGHSDAWSTVLSTDIRCNCLVSFKGYIYGTQNFFSHLYRFRPGVDTKLELITYFSNPAASVCHLGNRLTFFTRTMCGQLHMMAVEEYTGEPPEEKPVAVWSDSDTPMKFNDVSGSCLLATTLPPLRPAVSQFAQKHLARYTAPFLDDCL